MSLLLGPSNDSGTYRLTITAISDTQATPTASLIINTDGTTDKVEGATTTQINASTDYVTPNYISDTRHWVRFERISGDTAEFTGTLSTWLQCSGSGGSNRTISYDSVVATRTGVYSVEIALDSAGSLIVYGPTNYTLTATVI